jgi:hypothetical protein
MVSRMTPFRKCAGESFDACIDYQSTHHLCKVFGSLGGSVADTDASLAMAPRRRITSPKSAPLIFCSSWSRDNINQLHRKPNHFYSAFTVVDEPWSTSTSRKSVSCDSSKTRGGK